jgi:hypothetical protein|tara:strand:+ start:3433 stop:3555 length:123 start_codon:yes stop_codon:yes gene_type:complete
MQNAPAIKMVGAFFGYAAVGDGQPNGGCYINRASKSLLLT